MRSNQEKLEDLILSDPWRHQVLSAVYEIAGCNAWVAAGFVRNAVWDVLFDVDGPDLEDVDVLIFQDAVPNPFSPEQELQDRLATCRPDVPWQVRNQARMHLVNGLPMSASIEEAMTWWPETATAVAVQLQSDKSLSVIAPFGLDDLMTGKLCPCRDDTATRTALLERARSKDWFGRWPGLKVEIETANCGQFGRKNA